MRKTLCFDHNFGGKKNAISYAFVYQEQPFLVGFFTVVKTGQVLNRYFPRFEGWRVHAWIHPERNDVLEMSEGAFAVFLAR